jgi:hypothetical protein
MSVFFSINLAAINTLKDHINKVHNSYKLGQLIKKLKTVNNSSGKYRPITATQLVAGGGMLICGARVRTWDSTLIGHLTTDVRLLTPPHNHQYHYWARCTDINGG